MNMVEELKQPLTREFSQMGAEMDVYLALEADARETRRAVRAEPLPDQTNLMREALRSLSSEQIEAGLTAYARPRFNEPGGTCFLNNAFGGPSATTMQAFDQASDRAKRGEEVMSYREFYALSTMYEMDRSNDTTRVLDEARRELAERGSVPEPEEAVCA